MSYIVVLGVVALACIAGYAGFQTSVGKKVRCQGEQLMGNSSSCSGGASVAIAKPNDTAAGSLGVSAPTAIASGRVCTREGCRGLDNCFGEGTLVSVPGSLQPIEAIRVGDLVLARGEAGELAPRKVIGTKRSAPRAVIELGLRAGEHTELVRVTHEHPFRNATGWITAESLALGDHVLGLDGDLTVASMQERAATEPVFDITVDEFHTFFVGTVGAWVHNDCKPGETPEAQLARLRGIVTDREKQKADGKATADDVDYAQQRANGYAALVAGGKGDRLKYDAIGRVSQVTYPSGATATIQYKEQEWSPHGIHMNIASVTITTPQGDATRMYYRQVGGGVGRNRWFFDTGKGEADPEVFRGYIRVGWDGSITKVVGDKLYTTDPETGETNLSFKTPIYKSVETDALGGFRIIVSQGNNGAQISVASKATGLGSPPIRATFNGGEIRPKVVKVADGLIHISLDGSDRVHALVKVAERPFGEGAAWSDSAVPYYDEKSLSTIMKPLPRGTKEYTITLATAREQVSMTGIDLPADKNYIVPGRWKPEARGQINLDPRWGWVRKSDGTFVADATASGRLFMKVVEAYAKTVVHSTPVVGGVVMLGEAATGVEITGRGLTPRERTWNAVLGTIAVGLDFGPALYESAQFAKAAKGVETTMGVTNAEARSLLVTAGKLSPEEQAVLRAAGAGKPVPADALEPVILKLEGALSKVSKGKLSPPPGTWAEAELALAAPKVVPKPAPPVSTFWRKLAELPEMSIRALVNKYREIKVLRPLLDKATRTTETVPLSQIDMIHPLTFGAAVEKSASRAKALEAYLAANPALTKGEGPILITQAAQEQVLKSAGTMRAVRLADGRLVCFDGNGRLFSFFNLPPAVRSRVSLEMEIFTLSKAETDRVTRIVGLIRENNGAAGWNPVTRQFAADSNFARWMKNPGVYDQPLGPMLNSLIPSEEAAAMTRLLMVNMAAQKAWESTLPTDTGDRNNEALSRAAIAELKELRTVLGPAQKHITKLGGEDAFAAELVARAKAKGVTVTPGEALSQFLQSAAQNKGKVDEAFTPVPTKLFVEFDDD